eukprot:6027277-Pyramimonas_sp.AAC.6
MVSTTALEVCSITLSRRKGLRAGPSYIFVIRRAVRSINSPGLRWSVNMNPYSRAVLESGAKQHNCTIVLYNCTIALSPHVECG